MVRRILLLDLVILIMFVVPSGAATQYLTGTPDLTLTVLGVNDFRQGTDVTIPVLIKNTGFNSNKVVQSTILRVWMLLQRQRWSR